MKILVTGSRGFVGSNFIRLVRERHPAWKLSTFEGSILDPRNVEKAFLGRPEVLVNFAAKVGALASMNDLVGYARTNVEGAARLLEAARNYGTRRFIQMSTVEVYGTASGATEESGVRPESPYGVTKAAADSMTLGYDGLEGIVVRAPSIYGPFDRPTKMIPLFVSRALAGKTLDLYGDGYQVRDWMHVQDVCAGIAAAIEKGHPGQAYNIGTGELRTNLSVAHAILHALGKPKTLISFVPDRPGHGRHHSVDFTKARRDLGFKPHTRFSVEFPKTVLWYRR